MLYFPWQITAEGHKTLDVRWDVRLHSTSWYDLHLHTNRQILLHRFNLTQLKYMGTSWLYCLFGWMMSWWPSGVCKGCNLKLHEQKKHGGPWHHIEALDTSPKWAGRGRSRLAIPSSFGLDSIGLVSLSVRTGAWALTMQGLLGGMGLKVAVWPRLPNTWQCGLPATVSVTAIVIVLVLLG